MPSEAAQYTIAHELAHVYQHSAKLITDREYDDEGKADNLAIKWGFSILANLDWRAEHQNKSK